MMRDRLRGGGGHGERSFQGGNPIQSQRQKSILYNFERILYNLQKTQRERESRDFFIIQ